MAELYFLDRVGTTRRYKIEDDCVFTVGRRASNDVVVVDPVISASHTQIWYTAKNDLHHFRDLGSSNGTWLNGETAQEGPLGTMAVLYLGDLVALFVREGVFDDLVQSEDPEPSKLTIPGLKTSWHGNVPQMLLLFDSVTGYLSALPTLKESVSIGRHGDNDVVVDSPQIDEFHAKLVYRGIDEGWEVIHLAPDQSTLVNGKKVQRHRLTGNDVIDFDSVSCWLRPPLHQQGGQGAKDPQEVSETELLARKLVTHSQLDARLEHTLGKLGVAEQRLQITEDQLDTKGEVLKRMEGQLIEESAKKVLSRAQIEPNGNHSVDPDPVAKGSVNGHASPNGSSPRSENGSADRLDSELERKTAEIEMLKRELTENSDALWRLKSDKPDSDQAAALELIRKENSLIERLRRERENLSKLME